MTALYLFGCTWGLIGSLALRFWIRLRWAYKTLGIDTQEVRKLKNQAERKEYFECRYEEKIALIKWRVVEYLSGLEDPHAKEAAELLVKATEPDIRREQSSWKIFSLGSIAAYKFSPTNILHIELDEPGRAVHVKDAPEDLLKDVDQAERAADILGV